MITFEAGRPYPASPMRGGVVTFEAGGQLGSYRERSGNSGEAPQPPPTPPKGGERGPQSGRHNYALCIIHYALLLCIIFSFFFLHNSNIFCTFVAVNN